MLVTVERVPWRVLAQSAFLRYNFILQMFCPICKAEYRLGFIRCSDCNVDLVERLPDDKDDSGSPSGVDPQTSVALWEGTDVNTYAAVRMALNDAGIYHREWEAKSSLWGAASRAPFTILIQKPDEEAARKILADISGESDFLPVAGTANSGAAAAEDNTGLEIALPEDDSATEPAPDDIPPDFDPQDATHEVWSGEDKRMATYLNMSLNENGIGCVVVDEFGKLKVRVLPASEPRAKEIVRQVVDGTPPK
jgi:hypothetical protein